MIDSVRFESEECPHAMFVRHQRPGIQQSAYES